MLNGECITVKLCIFTKLCCKEVYVPSSPSFLSPTKIKCSILDEILPLKQRLPATDDRAIKFINHTNSFVTISVVPIQKKQYFCFVLIGFPKQPIFQKPRVPNYCVQF